MPRPAAPAQMTNHYQPLLLSSRRCRSETGEPTPLDAKSYNHLAIAFKFHNKKKIIILKINVSADSNHSAFTNFSRKVIDFSPSAGSTDSDEPNSIRLHQLLSDAEEDWPTHLTTWWRATPHDRSSYQLWPHVIDDDQPLRLLASACQAPNHTCTNQDVRIRCPWQHISIRVRQGSSRFGDAKTSKRPYIWNITVGK